MRLLATIGTTAIDGDDDDIPLGELAVKKYFWFEKNQFHVIQLDTWLQSGEYIIKMAFESDLRSELGGFYRMEYKRNDGTIV